VKKGGEIMSTNAIVLTILIVSVVALFGLGVYLGMTLKDEKWKSIILKGVKKTQSKKWTATITIDVSKKEPIARIVPGSMKPAKWQWFTKGLGLSQLFFY